MQLFLSLLLFFFVGMEPLTGLEYEAFLIDHPTGKLHKSLIKASELLSQKKMDVPNLPALKRIAEQDKEEMLTYAKGSGYLQAAIDYSIDEQEGKYIISFRSHLGNRYRLGSVGFYLVHPSMCQSDPPSLKDIPSFSAGEFFTSHDLLLFEHELIYSLVCRGYPKAKSVETVFEADKKEERLNLFFKIDLGPYTTFGPITVQGSNAIDPDFLLAKISMPKGSVYKKNLLDEAEKTLLQTGLLSSASFDESLPIQPDGTQPLILHVEEAKLHTIGAGINYMTTIGPGISCLYENRYFSKKGDKCAIRFDVWQRKKQGTLTLTKPSFRRENQNLLWIFEYDTQTYLPYHSSSFRLSCLLERQLTERMEAVYGLQLERLRSTHVLSDRKYQLVKMPCQIKWNNANSLFDPTKGIAFNMRLTPSAQYVNPSFFYLIHQSSLASYFSFLQDLCTLALKGTIGDILGANKNRIPIPDRFFGGSDSLLRGYKTGTISPRNKEGQFIGGDSLLAGTVELRIRQKKEGLGGVLFYDVGKVYKKKYPDTFKTFLHSVGFGIRYATPLGPLRLDIGFPLNRRKGVDPLMQLYFSIGQSF